MLRIDKDERVVCTWLNCPGFEFKIPITPCLYRVKDEGKTYSYCTYWELKDESMNKHIMQKLRKIIVGNKVS